MVVQKIILTILYLLCIKVLLIVVTIFFIIFLSNIDIIKIFFVLFFYFQCTCSDIYCLVIE